MASTPFASLLVTPEELHSALIGSPYLRHIIPVAVGQLSHLPSYEAQHVPGSIFFNMDEIRDRESPYPQMLPSASHFAKSMTALGLQPDDILVVYDALEVGLYSSPRVAWAWPLSTLPLAPQEYHVHNPDPKEVISYDELRDLLLPDKRSDFQIIDARIPGRFSGAEPEMNASLRSGHMPSALNVPLASILDEDKVILSAEELKARFQAAGVDGDLPVVLTCNSGVTAAALDLALQLSGYGMERRLYDGSWMEWTRRAQDDGLVVSSDER
ncbi:hypothetical protein BDW74DRAFT_181159 [Aspergillus multicolor]|uniref:sulfurtransferase n=1 Tax=Aspergillus multicolor TaxID=41759 RepID=UPI003CCDC7AA